MGWMSHFLTAGMWQMGHLDFGFLGGLLTYFCPCPLSIGGAWSPRGPCSGK